MQPYCKAKTGANSTERYKCIPPVPSNSFAFQLLSLELGEMMQIKRAQCARGVCRADLFKIKK